MSTLEIMALDLRFPIWKVLPMSNALKTWREETGLSVTEAAAKVGVTPAMWSRWENERRRIPAERIADLSQKTQIDKHLLRPDLFDPPASPAMERTAAA